VRSRRIEERAADVLSVLKVRKDVSLEELLVALADTGLIVRVAIYPTLASPSSFLQFSCRFEVKNDMSGQATPWRPVKICNFALWALLEFYRFEEIGVYQLTPIEIANRQAINLAARLCCGIAVCLSAGVVLPGLWQDKSWDDRRRSQSAALFPPKAWWR